MSAATTHLLLPYILAAQAQKHVTHNEALRLLLGLDSQVSICNAPPGTSGRAMVLRAIFVVCAGLSLCAAAAAADEVPSAEGPDLAAAETVYTSDCRNCHGPKAKGMASFPALAHQPEEYIALRLQQYRAGERVGPNTLLMAPHAAELSDDDIAGLAAYISTAFD